jgi:four helix bundle protein
MSAPSFETWQSAASGHRRADPLWRMTAYRRAAYAVEIGWTDVQTLDRARITRAVAAQLYRALGSIAANIAEGYSRSSGPDRARFFEYALGSARESREWYLAAQPVLGSELTDARIETLDHICRLLLAAIPRERKRQIRRMEVSDDLRLLIPTSIPRA